MQRFASECRASDAHSWGLCHVDTEFPLQHYCCVLVGSSLCSVCPGWCKHCRNKEQGVSYCLFQGSSASLLVKPICVMEHSSAESGTATKWCGDGCVEWPSDCAATNHILHAIAVSGLLITVKCFVVGTKAKSVLVLVSMEVIMSFWFSLWWKSAWWRLRWFLLQK